jgi:transposase InsO family protein
MKHEALMVQKPNRRRYSSYLGKISPALENIINREFQAAPPNGKWLTDIHEFHIRAGEVNLSTIIDCFNGLVISKTLATRPDADFVSIMLDAAEETIAGTEARPLAHSDPGG